MDIKNNKAINSIQVLRGLAALSVVMFHYRFYLVPDGADQTIPDRLFSWGAIGVDLFFVISGFIMIYSTNGKVPGLKTSKNFIVNRLTRILPTYYVLLLFAFLTGGAMSTFHYPEKISNLISALTFMPYLKEHAPLYIDMGGLYNIRWTLNYELYFYIAFSVCLAFKRKVIPLALWFVSPIIISGLFSGNITFSSTGYQFEYVWERFITNPIILEFGVGAIAGYAYIYLNDKMKIISAIIPISIFIVILWATLTGLITNKNVYSSIFLSFLVLVFALQNNALSKIIPKFLFKLGDISYSWYLIHLPVASLISKKTDNMFHSTVGFILMILMSILAASISHKYIEQGLSNKIKNLINKKSVNLKNEVSNSFK